MCAAALVTAVVIVGVVTAGETATPDPTSTTIDGLAAVTGTSASGTVDTGTSVIASAALPTVTLAAAESPATPVTGHTRNSLSAMGVTIVSAVAAALALLLIGFAAVTVHRHLRRRSSTGL